MIRTFIAKKIIFPAFVVGSEGEYFPGRGQLVLRALAARYPEPQMVGE
jgi:hypothetical protein